VDARYVRFLETVVQNRPNGRTFEAGDIVPLPRASARHWVVRNKAVYVSEGVDLAAPEADQMAIIPPHRTPDGRLSTKPEPETEAEPETETEAEPDGDSLESAPDVGGKDGGDTGNRTLHVGRTGGKNPAVKHPGGRRK